ncbi:MAG: hypothetical protein AAFV43_10890 [Planctomycetota bacterium]
MVRPLVLATLIALLPLASALVSAESEPDGADGEGTVETRVERLIDELGDSRYAVRRDASQALRTLGLRAFGQLRRGMRSPDAEIAWACEKLLRAAARRLDRPTDSQEVRAWLRVLCECDDPSEREVLLLRTTSVDALCRVAWFDPSERVSKSAAARLLNDRELRMPESRRERIAASVTSLLERFGVVSRPAIDWLCLATRTGDAADVPAADAAEWWRLSALRERAGAENASDDTSPRAERQLVLWWLREALAAGDVTRALVAVRRHVELSEEVPRALRLPLAWIAESGENALARDVLTEYSDRLADRRGLYLRAQLLREIGDEPAAAAAVKLALQTGDPDPGVASRLRAEGLDDWAIEELRAAGEHLEPPTLRAIDARRLLFGWQLDAAQYAAAVETIAPAIDLLSAMAETGQAFTDNRERWSLDAINNLAARRWLAEGLRREESGDNAAAAEAYEEAFELRGKDGFADADVLIAMHRLEEPEPGYRARVVGRIEELADLYDAQVLAQPDEPDWLNYWAWLVSNTVGDHDKAVRYSRRSLELLPDQPGLLDTLARCYFARGDVELAVETQRRAVELEPTAQVMQRQLAEFEAELVRLGVPADE